MRVSAGTRLVWFAGAVVGLASRLELAAQGTASTAIPAWAQSRFDETALRRGVSRSHAVQPDVLTGDFDGDGKTDVAVLVELTKSHKRGIFIVHAGKPMVSVVGAGIETGNGGDDFSWMTSWSVVKQSKGKGASLLVERAESGGGLIEYSAGRFRWKQHGD
jgi:hypothetical protein